MIEIKQLEKHEPESIHDYREILLAENVYPRVQNYVLGRIAEVGRPKTEVPFLVGYLRELEQKQDGGVDEVNSALRMLTGLDLPSGSTSQEWLEAWKGMGEVSHE